MKIHLKYVDNEKYIFKLITYFNMFKFELIFNFIRCIIRCDDRLKFIFNL